MTNGWRFEFFWNELDSYTCIARKGKTEITCDNFHWWGVVCDIVAACDEAEQAKE